MVTDFIWHEIKTMDGDILASTHSLKLEDKWPWIVRVVMAEAECHEDDIDIEESDDGDFITVSGKRYATVSIV